MILQLLTTTTANANKFVIIEMENKPFSITCDNGGVEGGTPTYSLSVCNFKGDEADFRLIDEATNLPLTDSVEAQGFKFAYLGLKYTSNSANGVVQFYLNKIV